MSAPPPILATWTGEGFEPLARFRKIADATLVVGERYRVQVEEERSMLSHNHQFAFLHEAWLNLPERLADQYPNAEHLRKALLIDAGFYKETVLDAGTNAAALRVAAQMRSDDEFARVVVRGPLVVRRVAKSQKRSEMKAKDFQEAKTKILDLLSEMIGVPAAQIERERAA